MTILVADDDPYFAESASEELRTQGYDTVLAADGAEALRCWRDERVELALVDAAMPLVDGFEVCGRIAREGRTAVIMVSALGGQQEILRAFSSGADDYVVKPVSLDLLSARIGAVLRRLTRGRLPSARDELSAGEIVLDFAARGARHRDSAAQLTRLEFAILLALARSVGRVVSARRLVELAWGYDDGDASLLKTHVSRLRQKLGLRGACSCRIVAINGAGYVLRA